MLSNKSTSIDAKDRSLNDRISAETGEHNNQKTEDEHISKEDSDLKNRWTCGR